MKSEQEHLQLERKELKRRAVPVILVFRDGWHLALHG